MSPSKPLKCSLLQCAPSMTKIQGVFYGILIGTSHSQGVLCGFWSPMWHPVLCVCLLSPDHIIETLMDLVRKARSRSIGSLHPSFNINKCIRDGLQESLPDNVHQIISGRACISLTRVSDGENVLVSDFHSKDEVVDVSICPLPLWVWSNEKAVQDCCLTGLGPYEHCSSSELDGAPGSPTMSGL